MARRRRRLAWRLSTVAVAITFALAPTSAAAAGTTGASGVTGVTGVTAPTLPVEVISPLPGTPDANPHTQVSFLGVAADDVHEIAVVGSQSGHHHGRLEPYSTGTGGSFVPSSPFTPGERVTVTATIMLDGVSEHVGTNFSVSSPYVLGYAKSASSPERTATNVQRFHSRPDLVPPTVSVTTPASDPTVGDIFVSPTSGPGQSGPMIVNPSGAVVWFHPIAAPARAFDFNVQSYLGKPVLTWWQGRTAELHGQGVGEIYSANYTPVATVRAGNGLYVDLHDFVVTPQGTAFITAYEPEHWNLRKLGGSEDGLIDDGVVQEIDVRTGLVMFEWHSLLQVPLPASYLPVPHNGSQVFDYFHINSIDPLPDGDILISSRHTWAAYLLNATTGAIIWQLGGKHSTFPIAPGARFAWQHDVEMLTPSATPGLFDLSVFDNEASPTEATESRGLELELNTATNTETLIRAIPHPGTPVLAGSQGDVQPLANGDVFIGWGQIGEASEVTAAGQLSFEMRFSSTTRSYRAYRYPWSGQPLTTPALSALPSRGGKTELYASWNGATDVASWTVLAGASAHSLNSAGTFPVIGFETAMAVAASGPYFQVEALGASGQVLHVSSVVKRA